MKDTFYFSHDYNARNDLKIQALIDDHGAAGYGIFWAITEILHEEETHDLQLDTVTFKAIAKQMSTSVEQVESVVKSCLTYGLFITNGDNNLFSDRVNENIDKRVEISEKRSKAGKISAQKRNNSTPVEQVLTSVQQNPTKERKGKERKDIISPPEKIKNLWIDNLGQFEFISKFYPKLFQLKDPLKPGEHDRLINDYGKERTQKMYGKLQNYKPLLQTSESAYLTFKSWIERDEQRK